MKVAFVYRKSNYFMSGKHFDNCTYNLYKALGHKIDLDYVCDDAEIDLKPLNSKYDALIFYDTTGWGGPDKYLNIDSLKIPRIYMVGDCHDAGYIAPGQTKTRLEMCYDFNFDYYFYQFPERVFYRYYPKEFKYRWIPFGIEESLYKTVKPYEERILTEVLNLGACGNKHYILRGACDNLPCVVHKKNVVCGQSGDNFVQLLEQYGGAIAAMTTTTCHKMLELPAAGCVSFMEVTEQNGAETFGFENGVNAVFIDEHNYSDVLNEYVCTSSHDKWRKIAENGRKYVLGNYTNDKTANMIIALLKEIL